MEVNEEVFVEGQVRNVSGLFRVIIAEMEIKKDGFGIYFGNRSNCKIYLWDRLEGKIKNDFQVFYLKLVWVVILIDVEKRNRLGTGWGISLGYVRFETLIRKGQ